MHYVTITGHSPSDMSDGVHKKQRHTPRHVSGRLSSFCCLLTSQTNLHKQFWYPPISDRPSRCRDSTIWQPCSGWTLWLRYEQRSLIVGLCHRQRFVHNLPVSATVPYTPMKLRISDKTEHCVTIGLLPFVSRLSWWAWNHAGIYTCMHMNGKSNEHASSPSSPNMGSMPGTTSSYHDVIIWGGHLFVFHVCDL